MSKMKKSKTSFTNLVDEAGCEEICEKENLDEKEIDCDQEFEDVEIEEIKKDLEKDNECFVGTASEMLKRDLKKYHLLTKEEELALAKKLKEGNEAEKKSAKEELILSNMLLVYYVAKRYIGGNTDFEDLISEGYIGLVNGIERFDYEKGTKLSTYVLYWIKQRMIRTLDNGDTIRKPVHIKDKIKKISKAKNEFIKKYGYEPSNEDISKMIEMDISELDNLELQKKEILSLDMNLDNDGNGNEDSYCLGDTIADEINLSPENFVCYNDKMKTLYDCLDKLTEREKKILIFRFGIGKEREYTLEEIGQILNITRERVRQIQDVALRKLSANEELKNILVA